MHTLDKYKNISYTINMNNSTKQETIVPEIATNAIESKILTIRNQQVMIDLLPKN